VAFVGRLHPVGIVFSALLMSMFYIGGELAQSRMGLPRSITGVFQGMLLFALLACDTLINYRLVWTASAALRATPSSGHRLQPGPAGPVAVPEKDTAGPRLAQEKS
jgi:simple sugar transport system permease protein